MAPGNPDSDADSLAFSDDSESSPVNGSRLAKAPQTYPDPDLSEYGKSLGANLEDPDLAWVVREAFHAALPASWAEFADDEGRVYFYNYTTNESTWNHPMDEVYRELIALVLRVRRVQPAPVAQERLHELIGQHLREVYDRASSQLANWSGPFRSEEGDCYYFNEVSQQSTWVNPLEEWEYELSIRQAVLQRCLLNSQSAGRESRPETTAPAMEDGFVPMLKLPGPGEDPDSPRSFHTARSSRSQCSARSMASATGSEASPGRMRSRGRSFLTVSSLKETGRLDSAPELTEPELTEPETTEPELTKPANAATAADPAATSPKHREVRAASEELEITFGHTAAVSLPTRSQVQASILSETLEGETPKHDQEATDSGPSTSTAAESQGLEAKIEEMNDVEVADETSLCAPATATEVVAGDELKDDLEATGSGPSTTAETPGLETKTDEGNAPDEVRDELLDEMDMTFGCSGAKMPEVPEADPAGDQPKLSSEPTAKVEDAKLAPDQDGVSGVQASLVKPRGGDEEPNEDCDGLP